MRSNDSAWNIIFNELKIFDKLQTSPSLLISAKQINEIGKREARLMAKFDTKESLPELFKKHGLNITAVSNGSYMIFKDTYHESFLKLPDYSKLTPQKLKPQLDFSLETLMFNAKMSESNAIDFAHHSKVLSVYSGEDDLRLTTRGRFFSDSFSLNLNGIGEVKIKGVQIEVDAGYEGLEQFLIIEAKSSTRESFNIRQLYYPFKHFQTKTKKKIRPLLLSFSNGVYYFTELQLNDNYYDYSIVSNVAIEIVIDEPQKALSIADLVTQETYNPKGIPVPQANDLNKVIDLLKFLENRSADKFEIAEYFEFNDRQGDYYGNAASYIGLVRKEGAFFQLTTNGKKIINIKNRNDRNIQVIKSILETKLFNDLLRLYLKEDNKISDMQIIDRIAQEGLTGRTPSRRSGSVKSWLNWIIDSLND